MVESLHTEFMVDSRITTAAGLICTQALPFSLKTLQLFFDSVYVLQMFYIFADSKYVQNCILFNYKYIK